MVDIEDFPEKDHIGLLLRETNHRHANDLQLIVSLLALQSRRAQSPETRAALSDVMNRVAVVAQTCTALNAQNQVELGSALQQVCQALRSHAEPRGISVSLDRGDTSIILASSRIATVALAVNELATNAIKHAFCNEQGGNIAIVLRGDDDGTFITVDDDGLPMLDGAATAGTGLGFGLVRRLIGSVGGTFTQPANGTKRFEIRMPARSM